MPSKDLHNNIEQSVAFNAATTVAAGNTAGNIIDNQFFEALEFVLQVNAYSAGTVAMTLEESDFSNFSTFNVVDNDDVLGDVTLTLSAANTTLRLGYVGAKQYVRCRLTFVGGSVNMNTGAIAILGVPHTAPTA